MSVQMFCGCLKCCFSDFRGSSVSLRRFCTCLRRVQVFFRRFYQRLSWFCVCLRRRLCVVEVAPQRSEEVLGLKMLTVEFSVPVKEGL